MLKINRLSAGYAGAPVIKDINLYLEQNEIVTLIGANGAGKSTLLRAISGIIKPVSGTIYFNDTDMTHVSIHGRVRAGIIHVPEGRKIFLELTVTENLIMGCYAQAKINYAELDFIYSIFPILKQRGKQLGGTLSGGEQQMLAIGRALMANPKVLILDEPSLGLAPIITHELFTLITTINQTTKVAILLIEQNATMALKIAHRGYVISNGQIILSAASPELSNSPQIKHAYLH